MKTAAQFAIIAAVALLGPGLAQGRHIDNDDTFAIQGTRNSRSEHQIVVEQGTERLTIQTYGGYGDLDLYLYRGTQSAGSGQLARSTGSNNNEQIVLNNPAPGRYNLVIHAYSTFSRATARVDFQRSGHGQYPGDDKYDKYPDQPGVTLLEPNRRLQNLAGHRGSSRIYRVEIPHGTREVVFGTDFGSGDVDLFVSRGRIPSARSSEYRSTGNSTTERIRVAKPAPGTWYMLAYAYRAYDNITLMAKTTGDDHNDDGGYYQPGRRWGRVTNPTEGEVWTLGNGYTIRWQSSGVRNVQVQFSTDGGRTWRRGNSMPASIDADRRYLTVNLPANGLQFVSNQVRIRLLDADRNTVLHTSGLFSVRRDRFDRPDRPGHPRGRIDTSGSIGLNDVQLRRADGHRRMIRFQPPQAGIYTIRIANARTEMEVEVMAHRGRQGRRRVRKIEIDDGDSEEIRLLAGPFTTAVDIYIQAEDDDEPGLYQISVQRG